MSNVTFSRTYSTPSGYKVEAIAFKSQSDAEAWAIQQRDQLMAGNEALRPSKMRSNSKASKVLDMIFNKACFIPNWGKPSKKDAFDAFAANPPAYGVFVTL
jgi:hypothetical protein